MSPTPSVKTEDRPPLRLLPEAVISLAHDFGLKVGSLLSRAKIHPNVLSVGGLAAGLVSGALFALNRPVGAALLIILCGALDGLDGLVASKSGRQSSFGAILDSSLDRYADFFIFAGLAYHFRTQWALWLTLAALLGSIMVSYTRARAEALGFSCRVGVMQRAERLVVLSLAGLVGPALGVSDQLLVGALGLIALLSHIAAGQRILLVRRLERRQRS